LSHINAAVSGSLHFARELIAEYERKGAGEHDDAKALNYLLPTIFAIAAVLSSTNGCPE
jgi:hypothetical protein